MSPGNRIRILEHIDKFFPRKVVSAYRGIFFIIIGFLKTLLMNNKSLFEYVPFLSPYISFGFFVVVFDFGDRVSLCSPHCP